MNEFLDFIGYALVAWLAYRFVMIYQMVRSVEKTKELTSAINELSKIIHTVKEETIGDIIYWFDAETDKFITQGATHDDIISTLKQHYIGHIFLINDTEMLAGPNFDVIPMPPTSIRNSLSNTYK